jgi:hypothetical protein
VAAAKEIADRIDGRVPSIVAGDRENPVQYQRIERVIVQVEDKRAQTIEHDRLKRAGVGVTAEDLSALAPRADATAPFSPFSEHETSAKQRTVIAKLLIWLAYAIESDLWGNAGVILPPC